MTSTRAFFWAPGTERLAAYEKAAPFRTLLAWYVESWGGQMAHASAIAGDAGGALVVGPGGVGKSTVALACWIAGLGFLSDDYCALLPEEDGTMIASVYATAKLEEKHLRAAWPELAKRPSPHWALGHDKTILSLHDDLHLHPRSVRLSTIVLPSIVAQRQCELRACTKAEALTALAPSSIFQTPRLGKKAFAFYAQLVARTPCVRLLLGERPSDIPEQMRRLLLREP